MIGLAGLLGVDQVGFLQHREMRRHRRLGDVELVAQLARAHRPLAQQLQHAAAGGIGKGSEHLAHDVTFS
jgi:hypothetical protein